MREEPYAVLFPSSDADGSSRGWKYYGMRQRRDLAEDLAARFRGKVVTAEEFRRMYEAGELRW